MDNQEAIETIKLALSQIEWEYPMDYAVAFDMAISALQEQEAKRLIESSLTQKPLDTISRTAAIDALEKVEELFPWRVPGNRDSYDRYNEAWNDAIGRAEIEIEELPSAQPTLHGYNIEHLELIARVLQKEDLPPERIVEALTDIGRIVAIVKDEFEEALRKAVEQCTM